MSDFIVYEVYGRGIETFTVIENVAEKTYRHFYNVSRFTISEAAQVIDPTIKVGPSIPYGKYKGPRIDK